MKKFLFILLAVALAVMAFFYFVPYSEGVRAGTIIKVSKRGTIFKTYEGQLNLEVFGAVKGKTTMNETFEFSIPKDSALIEQFENATGHQVKLYYVEKYFLFPWIGETKYIATEVKINDGAARNEDDKSFPRR